MRRKDWTCEADEGFDNIYCLWTPEDKDLMRIEPYYWHP